MVTVQVAELSHENFKSGRVMRWSFSQLSSRLGAKSTREGKPKWHPGLPPPPYNTVLPWATLVTVTVSNGLLIAA